jgi:hypothetical protein
MPYQHMIGHFCVNMCQGVLKFAHGTNIDLLLTPLKT